MTTPFAAFGAEATAGLPPIVVSGRHAFHLEAMSSVVADVSAKLMPQQGQRLLEIGCGPGLILRPMASRVREAVGMDHESVVGAWTDRPENVILLDGSFPERRPDGVFDRILVYSVLQYLVTSDSAIDFIDAALSHLAVGGRLMIGDLPNVDAQGRFAASAESAAVTAEYRHRVLADRERAAETYATRDRIESEISSRRSFIDDAFVLRLIRRARDGGVDAWVLPQPASLPFSRTREDLLFWKRP